MIAINNCITPNNEPEEAKPVCLAPAVDSSPLHRLALQAKGESTVPARTLQRPPGPPLRKHRKGAFGVGPVRVRQQADKLKHIERGHFEVHGRDYRVADVQDQVAPVFAAKGAGYQDGDVLQ